MERSTWRKILTVFFSFVLTATLGAALAACTTDEEPTAQEGPETGLYYYDADDGDTYYITLSDADRVSMQIRGERISGSYMLEGGTFAFTLGTQAEVSATYADDVITLDYDGSAMRFLRAVSYTLSYESNGGSAVASVKVMNGRTASKPADPVREGYAFIGWYADAALTQIFAFDKTPVTGETTVYARWSEELSGAAEYTVDFDLGYTADEEYPTVQTVGGKLYDVPVPAREGYTFGGWWVSDFQDGDKLTYRWSGDTAFDANTTLFALWQSADSQRLATPAPRVTSDGVEWDPVEGVATYEVEIVGPNDNTVYSRSTGSTSVSVDFSALDAGEYRVSVCAVGMTDSETSETAVRYYNNKALARVSLFSVIEPSVLTFNAVEGAENYKIAISCGDPEHEHSALDNGTSTWFDFSDCAMQEGGITFTVTASAAGRASSVSETFRFERNLDAVSTFYFDEETETLRWDAVPEATDYAVKVAGGGTSYTFTTGGKTQVSLLGYSASELTVSVTPTTQGYNSPAAGEYTYTRTRLPAPGSLKVTGSVLSWEAVDGATSYTVSVGGREYTVSDGTQYDLSAAGLTYGAEYELRVRAVGASSSAWSSALTVRSYALSPSVTYASGRVTWQHVVGATGYQVRVNEGVPVTVPAGTNYAAVTLTQAGENVISVRFTDDTGTTSAWQPVSVYAYQLTFDTREGSGVDPVYLANGDILMLPATTREGFTLGGWYNVPGAAASNGHKFADSAPLSVAGDTVLYASWTPNSYTVTYDMETDGGTVDRTQDSVTYTQEYQLAVPENTDTSKTFVGWFSAPNGAGVQYTDADGYGLTAWSEAGDRTLYPYWISIFTFTEQTSGTYAGTYSVAVTASASRVSRIVVPETYEGKPVSIVEGWAFERKATLRTIEIPDTIQLIYYTTAFEGCTSLEEIVIYETGNAVNPVYSSHNGILYYTSEVAQEGKELVFIPSNITGHYTIPDDVESIGQNAFTGANITTLTIPSSVTNIAPQAFYDNTTLTAIYFDFDDGDELVIGEEAFAGCTALKTFTIPARFTDFDPAIFGTASALETINVADDHESYSSADGMLASRNGDTIVYCPTARRGALRIPNGVTKIGDGAFAGCSYITSVTIPNYVVSIGEGAFENCVRLTTVTFAGGNALGSALTVNDSAFAGCTALATVAFQNNSNVVSLGSGAFSGSERLTSVTLPATLATLAPGALSGCTNLAYVYVDENSSYFSSENGVLFDKDKTRLLFYSLNQPATSYTVPETVKVIDAGVFEGNVMLTSVIFNNAIEEIGSRAFYGCTNLGEVYFVQGGTADLVIGASAFESCRNLRLVSVLSSVDDETIGNLNMPDNLKTIGARAFMNTNFGLMNTSLNEGLEEIGDRAFYGCDMLGMPSFTIPSTVTYIGASAFSNTGLMMLELAEGTQLETIGANAFSSTGLLSFTVPAMVTYVGESAFAFCDSLSKLVFEDEGQEVYIGVSAFRSSALESLKLPENVTGFYEVSNGMLYTAIDYCASLYEIVNLPAINGYTYEGGIFYGTDADGTPVSVELVIQTMDKEYEPLTYVVPNTVTVIKNGAFSSAGDGCTLTFEEGGDQDLTVEMGAFSATGLYAVHFPARLRTIGESAFQQAYCEEVTFEDTEDAPSRLEEIGAAAFQDVTAITAITFPRSLRRIGDNAFSPSWYMGDSVLAEINLNEGLEEIGSYAFANDSGDGVPITTLTIPASVKVIGNNAFAYATQLTSIMFAPDSRIEIIGNGAFRGSAITAITLPATLAGSAYVTNGEEQEPNGQLGGFMFYGCSKLTEVVFEDGCPLITSYGSSVFARCTSYANVTFPKNVTSIGSWGSSNGTIKTITIPAGFDEESFLALVQAMTALTSFTLEDGNRNLHQDGASGAIYDANSHSRLLYYPSCYTATSYTLLPTTRQVMDYAFYENIHLEEIVLNTGLESIGAYAFASPDNVTSALKSITVPETVVAIGEGAFYGAKNLESVTLSTRTDGSSALTTINNWAFRECTALKSIVIPDGVTTLGITPYTGDEDDPDATGAVFYGCTGLESATLPNGLTDLQSQTFGGCTSLTSVTIRENSALQRIAEYAFANSGLTSLDLTNAHGLVTIADYAFYNNPIGELTFGTVSDVSVGNYAFAGSRLTSLTIPANIISIGEYAFYNVSTLESVTVGEGSLISSIGAGAFRGTAIDAFDFSVMTLLTEIGDYAFYETPLTAIELPDTVTSVGAYAFYGCEDVLELKMSESIATIGEYAFAGLPLIEEVTIYGNNTTVGAGAFENCTALESVTLQEGVDYIGTSAFGFTALTSITLPTTIVTLDGNPFTSCPLETVVILAPDADLYFDVASKTMFNGDKTLLYYTSPTTEGKYVIPESVTAILPGAFAGSKITSITLPDNFTSIPNEVFKGCTELTSITIGKNVTSIGMGAFEGCTALETLTFKAGGTQILSIGDRAFYGCTSLKNIQLPYRLRDVTEKYVDEDWGFEEDVFEAPGIGEYAFAYSGLVTVTYETPDPDLSVEYSSNDSCMIGAYAFYNCTALTTAEFHDQTSGNQASDDRYIVDEYAFYNCTSLQSVKLVPSVEEGWPELRASQSTMGAHAFENCTSLTSFEVPTGLYYFYPYAFANSGLTSFYIQNMDEDLGGMFTMPKPVMIGDHVFAGCKDLVTFTSEATMENEYALSGEEYGSDYALNAYAFEGCTSLTTVKFTKATNMAENVFAGCTALTTVEMNFVESVRRNEANIGVNAFSGCTQLSSVTLTGDLEVIEAGAFANCTALKAITLPTLVTTVAATAFSGWQEDQTITVPYASEDALPGNFAAGWSAGAAVVYTPEA